MTLGLYECKRISGMVAFSCTMLKKKFSERDDGYKEMR